MVALAVGLLAPRARAQGRTLRERFRLPEDVILVDTAMSPEDRSSARVVVEALNALGERPLLLGTMGPSRLRDCMADWDCEEPVAQWLETHRALRDFPRAERFDLLFAETTGLRAPAAQVLHALELLRPASVRRYRGTRRADILVLSPELVRDGVREVEHRGPDLITLAPPRLDTPAAVADVVCSRLERSCTIPPPPIPVAEGQLGFRIHADDSGRPTRAERIFTHFGEEPGVFEVAVFDPFVEALAIRWSGGEQAIVLLTGTAPARVHRSYEVSITFDGEPIDYIYDSSMFRVTLPRQAPGLHVLEARISGGQLAEPLVDRQTQNVDWIADFGTLSPGAAPRCIPMDVAFGDPVGLPPLLDIEHEGEELCAAVSVASVSGLSGWPKWEGGDGITRELRVYAEPSPILWAVLAALFVLATFAMRHLMSLMALRRRPTHLVVMRHDQAGYRDTTDPERVVALAAGPLEALAPELQDVDATFTLDAVATLVAKTDFLFRRRSTAPTQRSKRVALLPGSAAAFGDVQVAFIDAETAVRVEAREFRALPVFSARELSAEPSAARRDLRPAIDAAILSLPVTLLIALAVGFGSAAVPMLGTYLGFGIACVALLAASYGIALGVLSRPTPS